jgi:lipopolysaccharide exporter
MAMPRTPNSPNDLGSTLVCGGIWMVAMRWATRGIGLLNTIILVRLLTPEDFGVVAVAMIVVTFVEAFNNIGLDLALIRTQRLSEAHYHSAWTLTMIIGAFNSAALVLVAPTIADFYDDPRLLSVTYVMATLPIVNGLINVRIVDFRRDFHFRKDFSYQIISRSVALPVGISFAFYFRDYWALVAGMLSQGMISLVVSYAVRPFRPRINFAKFNELFGFSVWIQLRSVGQALSQRIDQLYVGKILGARELGGYHVMQEITQMATTEVLLPLGRALLPGYSKMIGQEERLRSAFYKVLGFHLIIAMPITGGLYAVAPDLVLVLLGEQWLGFTGIFQILAIASGLTAIGSATGPLLIAIGRVQILALSVWARLCVSVLALFLVAACSGEIEAVAWTRFLAELVLLVSLLGFTVIAVKGRLQPFLKLCIRPTLATSLMVLLVTTFQTSHCCSHWLRLLLEISLGALLYLFTLLVLWWISGQRDSVEQEMLSRITGFTKKQ